MGTREKVRAKTNLRRELFGQLCEVINAFAGKIAVQLLTGGDLWQRRKYKNCSMVLLVE